MAVTFDSSATNLIAPVAGSASMGAISVTHNVSGTAPNLYALVAVWWWSPSVSAADAIWTVTFGGQAMTEVSGGQVFWSADETAVLLYYLPNPPSGPQTVQASFTGMPTEATGRGLAIASATYSGTAAVSAATTALGTLPTELQVSSAMGQMVANAFGCAVNEPTAGVQSFNSYSGTTRSNIASASNVNQPLIIGDAPGASTVDFTVGLPNFLDGNGWAAVGVPLNGTSVAYDATGASCTAPLVTTASWAHTIGGSATAVTAAVNVYLGPSLPVPTMTAKVGTTSMTLLASVQYSPYSCLYLFGLHSPPTGSQTISIALSSEGDVSANSVSYTGVTSFGTVATITGNSSELVVSGSAMGQMVANAFGCAVNDGAGGQSFNSYSGTTRSNIASSAANHPVIIGDAPGASTVDFTVGLPNFIYENGWAAVGVPLNGTSVSYDATGAGGVGYGSEETWSHTIGSTATAVIVAANFFIDVGSYQSAPTVTAQVGTTEMTLLAVIPYYPDGFLYLFGLLAPPTGTKTITLSLSDTLGVVSANSVSYTGVTSFGAVDSSTSNTASVTVASTVPACRAVGIHAISPTTNTFSYSGTPRAAITSGGNQYLIIGDAPGAPNVTLTATCSYPTSDWGTIGVNLTAAPVMLNASALIGPVVTNARLADYRSHTPSPVRTYTIPPTGAQPTTTYGRIGPQWTQASDSVLDYTLDWTQWLEATSDTIANVTFTPSDVAIQVISTNVDGPVATGWLTGGVNGEVYSIVVHITTTDGRQDDRTFTLIITQT